MWELKLKIILYKDVLFYDQTWISPKLHLKRTGYNPQKRKSTRYASFMSLGYFIAPEYYIYKHINSKHLKWKKNGWFDIYDIDVIWYIIPILIIFLKRIERKKNTDVKNFLFENLTIVINLKKGVSLEKRYP